jgi:hypothetical protein
LPSEITQWPADLVADLNGRYFDEAARQIGVTETNDFIFGELHTRCAISSQPACPV